MTIIVAGAGLAGLSAASYLQSCGVKAQVYEAGEQTGDIPHRAGIILPVMSKPISKPLSWLNSQHGLRLRPLDHIRRIVFHSRYARAEVTGILGSIILRGRDPRSLDSQLAACLSEPIITGRRLNLEELRASGTKAIWATAQVPESTSIRVLTFKGGLLAGRFHPQTVHVWRTMKETAGGYAYLAPISTKRATAFVICTGPEEPQQVWQRFWPRLVRDLAQEPDYLRRDEFHQRVIPYCDLHDDELVWLAGNCFGTSMPLCGLDNFLAILTGILAARAAAGHVDYKLVTQPLLARLRRLEAVNLVMSRWGDASFDCLLTMMKFGATPFFNSRLDLMRAVSAIVSPLAKV